MCLTLGGNNPGTGSASVTMHGSSLGLEACTMMMRSDQTVCEGTEWESETSVRCMVGHGPLGTRHVVMTVGERVGTASMQMSLDASSISIVWQVNMAGTESTSVTVIGAGFGAEDDKRTFFSVALLERPSCQHHRRRTI